MTKGKKITYWIVTVWLSLGMSVSGVMQLLHVKEEVDMMAFLHYPVYFLTILGVWKMLGVIAILVPKFPLVKEWAYAGFFFTASGALVSHIASNDKPEELFGPSLLIILTVLSWYFRPDSRKIISSTGNNL